ncbi:MAG: MBL fold metallo-hydrolase [Candidatus Heimdallarchaeota archaeon]|nr:MBL fold metallo-hydrolase [Candidatus Heimdallarchaeota archaeon]
MKTPKTFNNGKIKLTAYGAAGEVGRSAFILEDEEDTVLIEAGIKIQPKDAPSLAPEGLLSRVQDIDTILLSHAHIDHSGYIPALYMAGFTGSTYMTEPTRDILRVLWEDQLKIDDRHWDTDSMDLAYNQIKTTKYRQIIEIANGITIEFYNAAHILGSAMILIDWKGFRILYTGDINDQQTPLFDGFEIPDGAVDVLITETTNGLRQVADRQQVNLDFIAEIRRILDSGNKVIIPAFAVGRSQEILTVLTEHIKDYPIYVDGMINKMIEITERYLYAEWVDEHLLNRLRKEKIYSPFKYANVTQISPMKMENTHDFRRELANSKNPCIILTTSGMMEPSPLHTHLLRGGARQGNLIAVTGYQAEGTTGREILNGQRRVKLSVNRKSFKEIDIKAQVKKFGFSGHTTSEGIELLIKTIKPKQIFLVHGDPSNIEQVKAQMTNGVIPVQLAHSKPMILS